MLVQLFQKIIEIGVLKPAFNQRTVRCLIIGQLPDHFYLGAGMRKHIHKIVNNNIKVIIEQVTVVLYQFLPGPLVADLLIIKGSSNAKLL